MTAQQAHRVVVGVDGSIISVRALDRAAEEAALRGAALEIVYAVPDLDEAEPVLASALSRVRDRYPGLTVTTAPVAADPAQALAFRSRDAALTVVGTRGRWGSPRAFSYGGGFAGLLLGSVSVRLAAHTHGPLLVVRGEPATGPGGVLLGIESDADIDAAAYAFEEAARRGAPLRILHAWTYHRGTPAGLAAGSTTACRTTSHCTPGPRRRCPATSWPRCGRSTRASRWRPAPSAPARPTRCWRPPSGPTSSWSPPTGATADPACNWARSPTPCCITPTAPWSSYRSPPRSERCWRTWLAY
ncbi:universal stress protein [Actinacidiphila oryziradicis]|uniref:universal stress protein n=1 Tax=Actinacidiphila oryziradicis TaxID=2571141 RepID=UPI003211E55E|nr:Universal stress protein [Actinacidiphila oryziradicis]